MAAGQQITRVTATEEAIAIANASFVYVTYKYKGR